MDFTNLQQYQQKLIHMGVPGCEILVCQDHQVLYHARAGIAQPRDRYYLYSCTKPVTAVAAMICIEKGLFCLEDPVSRFLPAFADAVVEAGTGTVPLREPMTVRHLLTMSGGLDYDFGSELLKKLPYDATASQLAQILVSKPLHFQPGTQYQYSFCLDVLGAVIEQVTGTTLGQWFGQQIFQPLGMADTYFYLDGQKDPRIAKQFRYNEGSRQVEEAPATNDLVKYSQFYSGGAGLVSTAADYLRFADALACGESPAGCRILSKESIDLIRTSQLTMDSLNSSFTCTCGSEYSYGLGVRTRIHKAPDAPGSIGEFGWDGAAGADLLIDPEKKLSAVLLQHVLGWPELLGSFHLEFRDIVYRTIEHQP